MPPRSAVPTRTRSTRVPAAQRDVFASDEEEEGEPAPRDVSLGLEVLNEEGVGAVADEQPQLTVCPKGYEQVTCKRKPYLLQCLSNPYRLPYSPYCDIVTVTADENGDKVWTVVNSKKEVRGTYFPFRCI